MPVPHIIHQTWRDRDIPLRWRAWHASWRRHHPAWEHRLWTDEELRALVAAEVPWLLSIYDAYPDPIERVDVARVVILRAVGGLYVDLDYECLRPHDELLAGQELVLGLEPEAHAQQQGLARLVCNAWMASAPRHPFWDHVLTRFVREAGRPGALEATGPVMLTRCVQTWRRPLHLVPASVICPLDSHLTDLPPDEAAGLAALCPAEAVALHHWSGSWWRGRAASHPTELRQAGAPVIHGTLAARAPVGERPLVSCLMVTRGRHAQARLAVRCFDAQSWPERELVVVDDDPDPTLREELRHHPRVRVVEPAQAGQPLGALRNLAVAAARGAWVAQWDDDDLCAPQRLQRQLEAAMSLGAEACLLQRQTLWWPARGRLATSGRRPWEGTIVCRREALPAYAGLRQGEDTPVVEALLARRRVVLLDAPELYVYVTHGANTFSEPHHARLFLAASHEPVGEARAAALRSLARDLPLREAAAAAGAALDLSRPAARPRPVDTPSVLVLTPMRDVAALLPRYFALLERLEVPADRLSLGVLEGDSEDGTAEVLEHLLHGVHRRFASVHLARWSHGHRPAGDRRAVAEQRARRAALARARNRLLSHALRGQRWVLWLDADVVDYPSDVVQQLLAAEAPIVVPHCVLEPGGPTFDLNSFQQTAPEDPATLVDGIYQPPRGHGRRYLDALRGQGRVRLDAVGGTMLLVDADLHREGLVFPVAPVEGYLETEGLARVARRWGVQAWGLPDLEIVHAR